MGNRQLIRGVGAGRRTATGVILTTVAVLLIIGGCNTEPSPSAEVVAAGDIASCRTGGDEATAELVEGIDGTVLALGDEAYPRGTAANFEECYEPSWGGSRDAPSPSPATTSTSPKGPEATSSTSVRPQATLRRATTPTSSGRGTWSPSTATAKRFAVALAPPRRGGSRRTSPRTTRRSAPSLICTIHASAPGRNMAPLPGGWRSCGRHSTRRTPTWSYPATSTTTSASPRRTRRGRQIPRGASASS